MTTPLQLRPVALLPARLLALLPLLAWAAAHAVPPLPVQDGYPELASGHVAQAATIANQILAKNPNDGAPRLLLCRVDYAQNLIDPAVTECQAAAAALPNDSSAQLWLGRALGAKAAHAGALSAFGIARKVRDAFEHAVALGPSNVYAANDLAEYYVAAPALVGGGLDKASRLASTEASRFPALSHRILALIAEKKGDLTAAESDFKAAIVASPSPETYIDLAHFYQTHARPDDAVAAIKQALAADQKQGAQHGPPLVDAASILTDAGREPALAEQCLRQYIASAHQSDAAPVFKAQLALGRLLDKRGDAAGAKAQFAAAATLAPQFAPARKAAGLR